MVGVTSDSLEAIGIDGEWNSGESHELLMHTIHAYPAKFPAFIAHKAFEYAKAEGVDLHLVSDVFCGCGTVALEAKLNGMDFWGCDINPVATMIAKAKSEDYQPSVLADCFERIQTEYDSYVPPDNIYADANPRIRYWFSERNHNALYRLKHSIDATVVEEPYKNCFNCLFSSILKSTSHWLTKSIKPQLDPKKQDIDPWEAFANRYGKLRKAVSEISHATGKAPRVRIETLNFLEKAKPPKVDMIISSPPYVTSYEYADLHQLSSLWLRYVEDDYKELRKGSIGSSFNNHEFDKYYSNLNSSGKRIVDELMAGRPRPTSQIRAVARYYSDMQQTIQKCAGMLNDSGMVLFVVGDTEYHGVKVKNSEQLVESLGRAGFTDLKAAKRRISNKLLTPYRDSSGRFTSNKRSRTVYHEEFVISGRLCR